jgi:hypothetical protein
VGWWGRWGEARVWRLRRGRGRGRKAVRRMGKMM